MKRLNNSKCGLTLIDVIIILFLLAIVAAIIFPMFARSGHHGRSYASICRSNLKELGAAVNRYCADNNGRLPSSMLFGHSKTWNEKDFVEFAGTRGALPPSPDQKQTWTTLIYPYLKNKDIIWCPSDPDRLDQPSATVSYFWKAAIDRAWYGGYTKLESFDFPADQILLYEHNGWHFRQASGLSEGVYINCVFMDGHVGSSHIKNSGYTASEKPAPLPKSGKGEPAWFNSPYGAENARAGIEDRYWAPKKSAKDKTSRYWDPKMWGDRLSNLY